MDIMDDMEDEDEEHEDKQQPQHKQKLQHQQQQNALFNQRACEKHRRWKKRCPPDCTGRREPLSNSSSNNRKFNNNDNNETNSAFRESPFVVIVTFVVSVTTV
ncbi:hypothetical protein HMI54_009667 [Coelomomyces lativittatus]|nr:hypothetical protein HMI54_009667 [Coelomomyces lativittatus]